ncbi:Pyridoxamine 5'-phosphate oxidase [Halogranum amylolyticum]|uniref:Pyridoxamine 5'-phosphate oxidase n=1 Tax=Halogranum amylolyticum TaxID=660520 RepID=A0A1H8VYQ4_9EURY|nr:pyridoxamine 5'-phosphate oxidase family protein [Halogranum amylolyticum]SEP20470.1 Pyridoxamine 5'-phosphate oxidase [Halogranum amylolyticum]
MEHDRFAELQGIEMSGEEAERFLRQQGFGVLSLARENEAYGIPISFGYDDENLYFVLLRPGAQSKKEAFIRETETASFLVYDVDDKHDWRSVVVTGRVEPVDDDEWPALRDALEENAWFPSLFSETQPMQDILGWRFVVDEITGQKSHETT